MKIHKSRNFLFLRGYRRRVQLGVPQDGTERAEIQGRFAAGANRTRPSKIKNGGFIALISAIIISVLLLSITFSLSLSGYFARFNVLNTELKKHSVALAEACGDTALITLAQGLTITATTSVALGADTCTIYPMLAGVATTTIKTQAVYQNIFTNLKIVATNASASVVSWEEVPSLP